VCLFHFAPGSPAGRLLFRSADRLALVYHNITPARFFLGWSDEHVRLGHQGRRELHAFASRAELGLGVSEFNRRELEAEGFPRTAVLPFLLDLDACRRPPGPVVRRLYADGRTNVLFVGRIAPHKRLEDLIRAFAAFRRHRRRSRLLLVGAERGHERYAAGLRLLVRALRLDDVVFAGHVDDDDLLAYYAVADVFACLSEHEGYGVPLVEAMTLGIPVLAYDAGAVRETLGGGGVLLGEKSPEVVAELLERLVADASFRRAVLATQERAIARLRSRDPGALLMAGLGPVLEGRRP
jgi:L-malate glycosyltransferase